MISEIGRFPNLTIAVCKVWKSLSSPLQCTVYVHCTLYSSSSVVWSVVRIGQWISAWVDSESVGVWLVWVKSLRTGVTHKFVQLFRHFSSFVKPMEDCQVVMPNRQDFEKLDINKSRFPYCIVWTPIPLLTWVSMSSIHAYASVNWWGLEGRDSSPCFILIFTVHHCVDLGLLNPSWRGKITLQYNMFS